MAVPARGGVVLLPFPFSDLSQAKLRPAIVLAEASRGDFIMCQVTSNPFGDANAVSLSRGDFASGALQQTSYARPGKLFTASDRLITRTVGQLSTKSLDRIIDATVALLRPES